MLLNVDEFSDLHSFHTTATISSFRDFILFTELCHSSSDETRWNRLVVVVHLQTFNITVGTTSVIVMNNSIKQSQRARFQG